MRCPLHPEWEQPCACCAAVRGIAEVRAALAAAPKPDHGREPDPPDTTHALAIARKRIDQTNARTDKETRS